MRSITFLSFVLVTTSPALAEPLVLAVDESRSSANVELCMTLLSTACDTGTTPISGTVTVAFDCPPTPGEIILHDFTFELVNDVHLDLNFGNGMFNSVGRDVVVRYAEPGGPRPPEPLTDGGFAVSDVTSGATGYLDYATTGLVCTLFTLVGYPCADTIDLTTLTLEPLDMAGSVVISGDAADLALDITVSGPIDPDLGTLDIVGTIHAAGAMPPPCCPGGSDRR